MHEPKVAGLLFLTFHIIKADRFTKTGSGQIQQDNSKQNVVPIRPIWTRSLPLQLAYSGAVRKRLSPLFFLRMRAAMFLMYARTIVSPRRARANVIESDVERARFRIFF